MLVKTINYNVSGFDLAIICVQNSFFHRDMNFSAIFFAFSGHFAVFSLQRGISHARGCISVTKRVVKAYAG